jgi:hypothetical protein
VALDAPSLSQCIRQDYDDGRPEARKGESMTLRVAIPLGGKMAARSFHSRFFVETMRAHGIEPIYFAPEVHWARMVADGIPGATYAQYRRQEYLRLLEANPALQLGVQLRRFGVHNESRTVKFAEQRDKWQLRSEPTGIWQARFVDALSRSKLALRASAAFERRYPTQLHLRELLELGAQVFAVPALGSYGFWPEGKLALEARRAGLPIVSVISNYDNLLNRGTSLFSPDRLAVWGPQMRDDAMNLHGFSESRVSITGPVQFDRYHRALKQAKAEFLQSYGLTCDRPTVLLAGELDARSEVEFCKLILGHFGSRVNLIYRPYPDPATWSLQAQEAVRTLQSAHSNFGLSLPSNMALEQAPGAEFGFHAGEEELASLLRYSDVLVNFFSTLSLEASLCDLPSINVAWGHGRLPVLLGQTHNLRPLRRAASKMAISSHELFRGIEAYIEDKAADREARFRFAESECGPRDGKATERLAMLIRNQVA